MPSNENSATKPQYLSGCLCDAKPRCVVRVLYGDLVVVLYGHRGLVLVPHLVGDGFAEGLHVPGVGPAHLDHGDHLEAVTDDLGLH